MGHSHSSSTHIPPFRHTFTALQAEKPKKQDSVQRSRNITTNPSKQIQYLATKLWMTSQGKGVSVTSWRRSFWHDWVVTCWSFESFDSAFTDSFRIAYSVDARWSSSAARNTYKTTKRVCLKVSVFKQNNFRLRKVFTWSYRLDCSNQTNDEETQDKTRTHVAARSNFQATLRRALHVSLFYTLPREESQGGRV